LTDRELRKLLYDAFSEDAENLDAGGDGGCEGNIVNDGIYNMPIIIEFIVAREVEGVDVGGSVSEGEEVVDERVEKERVVELEDWEGSPKVNESLTQNARLNRRNCVQKVKYAVDDVVR